MDSQDKEVPICLLATIALAGEQIPPEAKWIAQDCNGRWFAYVCKPAIDPPGKFVWSAADDGGYLCELGQEASFNQPKDFTKEIYKL